MGIRSELEKAAQKPPGDDGRSLALAEFFRRAQREGFAMRRGFEIRGHAPLVAPKQFTSLNRGALENAIPDNALSKALARGLAQADG